MLDHILSQSDTLLTDLDYVLARPALVTRIHSADMLPTVLMIRPDVDLGRPRIARVLLGDIARIRLPLIVQCAMPECDPADLCSELTLALDDFESFVSQQAHLPDKPKLVRFVSESSGTPSEDTADDMNDSEGDTTPSLSETPKLVPVASFLDQPDPVPLKMPATEPKEPSKPTWLLVEDNVVCVRSSSFALNQQINAKMGQRILEKLGYRCVLAFDGQQAIDALLRDPPATYTGILCVCERPAIG